jgi:hypothetical protein
MKDSLDEWAVNLLEYKMKLKNGVITNREYKKMEEDSYMRFLGQGKKSII